MKTLTTHISSLLGFGIVAVLVIALVFTFGYLPGIALFETQTQQPYPPPIMTPTLVVPKTPQVESTMAATMPTPLPERGVYVNDPIRIGIPSKIKHLSLADVAGNILVARAELDDGVAVLLVDIESGQTRLLNEVQRTGAISPRISGKSVTWIEPSLDGNLYVIKLYNLVTDETSLAYTIRYHQTFDFDGDIAIFSDYRNNQWGLYAYYLQKAHEVSIAEGNLGCSRINYPWITYMESSILKDGRVAEASKLWAFNIETSERLLLGSVFSPRDSRVCNFYALGANYVSWLEAAEDPAIATEPVPSNGTNQDGFVNLSDSLHKLYAYDLRNRTTHLINLPVQQPSLMLLSGDILVIGRVGVDLTKDVAFNIPNVQLDDMLGSPLLLADDKLIWMTNPSFETPQNIYVASIVR